MKDISGFLTLKTWNYWKNGCARVNNNKFTMDNSMRAILLKRKVE